MKASIFVIFAVFFSLQCKNPEPPKRSSGTNQGKTSLAKESNQCHVPSSAKLALAEETIPTPVIAKMELSTTSPTVLTYSSEQTYDHAEIAICKEDNTCEKTYSYTDSKILSPDKKGVIVVKLKLCFDKVCSPEKVLRYLNKTALDEDKKAVADRLKVLDGRLLELAKQRLKLESDAIMTPYVFLRTFEELYVNQPQRLELANDQCNYVQAPVKFPKSEETSKYTSLDSSPQGPQIASNDSSSALNAATKSGTGTDVGTDTAATKETTQSLFKTISQYLGIASTVLSFVMLGRDVYMTYKLNMELIDQHHMLKEVQKAVDNPDYVKAMNEDDNFKPLRDRLKEISVDKKYAKYFAEHAPSKGLLDDLEEMQNKIEKVDRIQKDPSILEESERTNKKLAVENEIDSHRAKIGDTCTEIRGRDLKIPPENKKPLKGYAGGIGKFLAGVAVSAGFLAYGYSLSDGTNTNPKNIDAEIFIAINERKYLLEEL